MFSKPQISPIWATGRADLWLNYGKLTDHRPKKQEKQTKHHRGGVEKHGFKTAADYRVGSIMVIAVFRAGRFHRLAERRKYQQKSLLHQVCPYLAIGSTRQVHLRERAIGVGLLNLRIEQVPGRN